MKIKAIRVSLINAAYWYKVHGNALFTLRDMCEDNNMNIWDEPYDEHCTMEKALDLAIKGEITPEEWTNRLEEIWKGKSKEN